MRSDRRLLGGDDLLAADQVDVDPAAEERCLGVEREALPSAGGQLHLDAVLRAALLLTADTQLAVDRRAVVRDKHVDRRPGARSDMAAEQRVRLDAQVGIGRHGRSGRGAGGQDGRAEEGQQRQRSRQRDEQARVPGGVAAGRERGSVHWSSA